MGKSGKEVGGVRVVAGAEVGCRDGNVGVHRGQCVGIAGWAGAREGEGEGEGSRDGHREMETEEMGEAEEAEELGETGAGVEKDGDGEMEVEEMLKEAEKLADEAVVEE